MLHLPLSPCEELPAGTKANRNGFALVISLILMAFVMLLLLAVSSLVQVETSASKVGMQQLIARSNAMLGLQVALGELQKQTGSDLRSTARAAILDSDFSTERVDDVHNPHWTGVWHLNAAGGARELLTWLVSGNQSLDVASGDFMDAESAVLDDTNSVELVSAGTIGNSVADLSEYSVRAKTVSVDTGDFAYWISGEQVKAMVNKVDTSVADAVISDEFPRTLSRQYQFAHLNLSIASMLPDSVNRAMSLDQTTTALGYDTSQVNSFKQYYHDLTVNSKGLLTNASEGGIKVDLTALLEANSLPTTYDGQPIYQAPTSILNDSLATQSPTWNYLKSFYDLKEDVLDDGQLTPSPGTSDRPGISPVIASFSYGLSGGLYINNSDPTDSDNNRTFINIYPKLVLYNPYNVALAAKDYAFVFFGNQVVSDEITNLWPFSPEFRGSYHSNYPTVMAAKYQIYEVPRAYMEYDTKSRQRNDKDQSGSFYPGPLAPSFIVQSPEIPPGEALVFMPYNPDNPGEPANFDRFGDRPNYLTNNSDGLSFRWFTNSWLKPQTDPSQALDSVQWNFHRTGGHQMNIDGALLEVGALSDTTMWRAVNKDYHRHLFRRLDDAFTDQVYQLTGRIQMRTSEYENSPVTNTYGFEDLYAPEQHTWSAYAMLSQDSGHLDLSSLHEEFFRPYANFNPRAKDLDSANIVNTDGDVIHNFYQPYATDPNEPPVMDYYDDDKKVYLGGGYTNTSGGVESFVMYDLPMDEMGFYSLGQLQHMQVSQHFDEPNYAIGNSLASPFIARDEVYRQGSGDSGGYASAGYIGNMDYSNVDVSYLLNEAVWDQYFFSTIQNIGTAGTTESHEPLNPMLQFFEMEEGINYTFEGHDTNAASLYVSGAFNVNSTSVVAWESLLSALNGVVLPDVDAVGQVYPFFRFIAPKFDAGNVWAGIRELTQSEIHELAVAIVEQIKMRGPAATLASFVNRKLVASSYDTDGLGLSGALQSAIDVSGINDLTEGVEVSEANTIDFPVKAHALGRTTDGIASSVTQGDLLTAFGPLLTVRSDTFTIRSYGDSINPVTGQIEGRAWCEAVVQRMPEYLDASSNEIVDRDGSLPELSPINASFGRRYKILSIRWLSEGEV